MALHGVAYRAHVQYGRVQDVSAARGQREGSDSLTPGNLNSQCFNLSVTNEAQVTVAALDSILPNYSHLH